MCVNMKQIHKFYIFTMLIVFFIATKETEGTPDPMNKITCDSTTDCHAIKHAICFNSSCECPDTLPIFVNVSEESTGCFIALNLTCGNCTFSQQCNYEHGRCQDSICMCEQKFQLKDGKCILVEKNTLIPIVVGAVIGICVVGTLCIYLWLSRKKE